MIMPSPTIDQDSVERGADRIWTLSRIERLQIHLVCEIPEVPCDPDLVLARRARRIPVRIIQLLNTPDGGYIGAVDSGIRVHK